ncbi:MAG: hypothetical protein ACJ8FY_26995 [Gemmataceae bacterium]
MKASSEENLVTEFTQSQLQHFRKADPNCRALQLPEGIMLRYTLSEALYFYLRSGVKDGKILTRVFASDSPYDRLKTGIGEVTTPMFEPSADFNHFQKLETLLHSWVNFVKQDPDAQSSFQSFEVQDRQD